MRGCARARFCGAGDAPGARVACVAARLAAECLVSLLAQRTGFTAVRVARGRERAERTRRAPAIRRCVGSRSLLKPTVCGTVARHDR